MSGHDDSVDGTYIPPGRATEPLMVYDLNKLHDDVSKGIDGAVPDGANYRRQSHFRFGRCSQLCVYPKLKVNEALSIQGSYRIGSWADPSQDTSLALLNFSRYLNSQAPGIARSFSPGYWNIWYATAILPWGSISVGKQLNTISLGFIIDTSENTNEGGLMRTLWSLQHRFSILCMGPGKGVNYPLKADRTAAAQLGQS
jgi:hypothetical protein